MFITEGIKFENSTLLMGFMRQALAEQVKELGGSKEQLEYIIREASDGDVLAYAMYGEAIPKEIDRNQAVAGMLEHLKVMVLENAKEADIDGAILAESIVGLGVIDADSNSSVALQEGVFKDMGDCVLLEGKIGDFFKYGPGGKRPNAGIKYPPDQPTVNSPNASDGAGEFDGSDKPVPASSEPNSNPAGEFDGAKGPSLWQNIQYYIKKIKGTDFSAKASAAKKAAAEWFAKPENKQKAGAAAIVAIAAFIGFLAYRAYKKKKEGACANLSGDAKVQCMANAKKAALQAQIAEQNKAKSFCAKSKDPASCRSKIDAKISKLRAKLV